MTSQPHLPHTIYLTGFMASGKSTAGQALARTLGWRFIDLDTEVERHAGLCREAIFAAHGEPTFRRLEQRILAEVVDRSRWCEPRVVALGGGTFVDAGNRESIARTRGAVSVWLDCPFPLVHRRIAADARRRRLTHHLDLPALLKRRLGDYAHADHRIAVHTDRPVDVVAGMLACFLPVVTPSPVRRSSAA